MSRFNNKPLNIFFKTWAQNLEVAENVIFHLKEIVLEFFSGSDNTLKEAKHYDLGFVVDFFVAVRSHQQPMHGAHHFFQTSSSEMIL